MEFRGEKLEGPEIPAYIVSAIFYPVLTLPVGLALFLSGFNIEVSQAFTALSLAVLPVLGFVYYDTRAKGESTLKREDRDDMYIFATVLLSMNALIFYLLSFPKAILILAILSTAGAALFTLTNSKIKISVHTGCISAAAGLNLYTGFMPFFLLGTVLVSWSRLRLGRHDLEQVLLGIVAGLSLGILAALTS
jgi:hypothetical protein